jgi:hypothetical protein
MVWKNISNLRIDSSKSVCDITRQRPVLNRINVRVQLLHARGTNDYRIAKVFAQSSVVSGPPESCSVAANPVSGGCNQRLLRGLRDGGFEIAL